MLLAQPAQAQTYMGAKPQDPDSAAKRYPTYNTSTKYYEKPGIAAVKTYTAIYVSNPQSVLYGNYCVTEYTHKLGFEYIPTQSYFKGRPHGLNIRWHNFKANWRLNLKQGLGWRKRVRKRIAQCKRSSGDFRG
jgi:hypothetical protein